MLKVTAKYRVNSVSIDALHETRTQADRNEKAVAVAVHLEHQRNADDVPLPEGIEVPPHFIVRLKPNDEHLRELVVGALLEVEVKIRATG